MTAGPVIVVVVTGLSGAGKSTALNALEDAGFFCVDNLPIPVFPEVLTACEQGGVRRIALGLDVRVRSFFDRADQALRAIPVDGERRLEVLFLEASDDALLKRFSATRRPHPLSHQTSGEAGLAPAVLEGIARERELLSGLRNSAQYVIDTSALSVHELRRRVLDSYGPGSEGSPGMRTRVMSFGFKYGAPVDADVMLDVRFLPNPFFVEGLRALAGTDAPVRDYVLGNADAKTYLEKTIDLMAFSLPRYQEEGKSYLTVAIGCTGGRHRSVALSVALADALQAATGLTIEVVHRDLDRDTIERRGSGAAVKDER